MERTLTLRDYCNPYISDLKVEDTNGHLIARGDSFDLIKKLDETLLNRKVAHFRFTIQGGQQNYDTTVQLCAEESKLPEEKMHKVLWVDGSSVKVVVMTLDDESLAKEGFTKVLYPFENDFVAVLCKDSPDNCSVTELTEITGPFIITSLQYEGYSSLMDEQIEKYTHLFAA